MAVLMIVCLFTGPIAIGIGSALIIRLLDQRAELEANQNRRARLHARGLLP